MTMMTPELTALVLAALLQVVQLVLFSIPANLELGSDYTTSPRDGQPARKLSQGAARLQRALDNHFEGLILFTIACVAVTLSGKAGTLTAVCAWAYLAARVAYIPAYYYGLSPWRSLIWAAGFFATLLMLLAALV